MQIATPAGAVETVSAGQTFLSDGSALTRRDPVSADDALAAGIELMRDPVAAIQQSPWYKQRFAPLLRLRDWLVEQGVEADELELLAVSADLWCLQYPKDPSAGLPPYIHRKADQPHGFACRPSAISPSRCRTASLGQTNGPIWQPTQRSRSQVIR